jgi:hypothetical protein
MKLKELVERQQQIINTAKAAERDLTPEEQSQIDNLQREIDKLVITGEERDTAPDVQEAITKALDEERKRVSQITSMCREFDIDPTEYINDRSMTVDLAREKILDSLIKNKGSVNVRVTRDGHADGELRRMSPSDLYDTLSRQFYNPTSAFPAILDTTIRKSIVEIYNKIPTTHDRQIIFSPQITINGNADKSEVEKSVEEAYEQFKVFIQRLIRENKRLKFT